MNQYLPNDELRKAGPHFRDAEGVWAFKSKECPMLGPNGCIVPHEHKPMVCKLFPFMAVQVYSDKKDESHWELVLLVNRCANWKAFGDNYDTAMKEFENG